MSTQKKPKQAARRHRRTATEKDGAITLSKTMKCVLWALPITVAVGLLLLLLSTALLLATKDPDRYHTAAALACLYITAFLGGLIATRLCRRRSPLLCGLCEAVLLIVLFTVLAFCLPDGWRHTQSGGFALLTRILLLPATMIGSFVGARKRTAKRRH
ncbi:MAG: YrzE family protein [Clostridia bacterium]|nr:YrzE family protein [Clostridia bacterium]